MFLLSEKPLKKMTLSKQLLLSFLLALLGAIGIVSYFFYQDSRTALIERAFEQLTSVKTLKKTKLQELFASLSERATALASIEDLSRQLHMPNMLTKSLANVVLLDSTRKVIYARTPCPSLPLAPIAHETVISDLFWCDSTQLPMFSSGRGLGAAAGFYLSNPLTPLTPC